MAPHFTPQHAFLEGERFKEAEKLTPSQQRMLWDVKLHHDPMHSRSREELGAARSTLLTLRRKKLLTDINTLTAEGHKMTEVEWRDAPEQKPYSKRGPKAYQPVMST